MSFTKRITEMVEALLKAEAAAIGVDPTRISRGYLPVLKKELIQEPTIVIAPAAIVGEEEQQARDQEVTTFSTYVAVTQSLVSNELDKLDEVTAVVERMQDTISHRDRWIITLSEVTGPPLEPEQQIALNLPFASEPLYDAIQLRESGIFLSVTQFFYHVDRDRS